MNEKQVIIILFEEFNSSFCISQHVTFFCLNLDEPRHSEQSFSASASDTEIVKEQQH